MQAAVRLVQPTRQRVRVEQCRSIDRTLRGAVVHSSSYGNSAMRSLWVTAASSAFWIGGRPLAVVNAFVSPAAAPLSWRRQPQQRYNAFVTVTTSTTKAQATRATPPDDFTIHDDDDDEGYVAETESVSMKGASSLSKDDEDDYDDDGYVKESSTAPPVRATSRRQAPIRRGVSATTTAPPGTGASWMDRNAVFTGDAPATTDSSNNEDDAYSNNNKRSERQRHNARDTNNDQENSSNTSFRQDFRGSRVFVQGIGRDTSWQDLKDHFRIAGNVVFASISRDRASGRPKGHGIVQFETTQEAAKACKCMRDHPLAGHTLYVREDVQEASSADRGTAKHPSMQLPRGPTPPSKWKCANEDHVDFSDETRRSIQQIIRARDQARRRRNYEASDSMREDLKRDYNVHLDDRLNLWWAGTDENPNAVPSKVSDQKGDGRWGARLTEWRQIRTTLENDACVDPDLVQGLLKQRDVARREKDFVTADRLLKEARTAPDGDLELRIHDESRTWRVWTVEPPPREYMLPKYQDPAPDEECLQIVREHAPHKVAEVEMLLGRFPGRHDNILQKLKQRYLGDRSS